MATLLEMTADILSAHASSNQMTTDELLATLTKIHSSLKALETGETVAVAEEPKQTISGKNSIKKNEVICLICEKGGFKTLARHLNTAHQIKPKDYKKQFGIQAKQSLSAKSLTEARKKNAIDKGLGNNLAKAREVKAANVAAKKATAPKKAAVPAVKVKAPVPAVKVKAAVPAKINKKQKAQ